MGEEEVLTELSVKERVARLETNLAVLGSYVGHVIDLLEHSAKLSRETKQALEEMADDAERLEKLILAYIREKDDALE